MSEINKWNEWPKFLSEFSDIKHLRELRKLIGAEIARRKALGIDYVEQVPE